MRHLFLHFSLSLAVLLLWQIAASARENDQIALRNMVEKARNIGDIRAAGMPGFHMLGDVRIWVNKDAPIQGKYLLVWTPDGNWREELAFNGYRRVRIGRGKQFWQVRSTEIENAQIFGFDDLMKIERGMRIEEDGKLKKLRSEKIEGSGADCVRYVAKTGFTRIYCFNSSTGELLASKADSDSSDIPWRVQWEEYSQYQQWAGKSYPRMLRGFNGKRLVIEVQLDELTPPPQLPQNYFDPPKEATVWSGCPHGELWKLKDRVVPVYPPPARMQGEEGTVILYARIEEDGHVSNLHIVHSAAADLDQAAAYAVSRWRYEPTPACVNFRGPAETLIDVIFTLRR